MKPASLSIILVFTGLGVGYFSSKLAAGRFQGEPSNQTTTSTAPTRGPKAPSGEVKTAGADAHDLKSLKRWYRKETATGAEITAQVERLDSEAIRGTLSDLASLDPSKSEGNLFAMKSALETLASELFRREGEQALQWANSVQPAEARKKVLTAMVAAALAETPALAKPWFDRYLLEFGKNEAFNFGCAATRGATARGAEDLVKLKEIFGNELLGPVPNGPLPEGFNFNLLLDNFSAGEPEMREAVQQWASRTPNEALAEIRNLASKDEMKASLCVGALFAGIAAGDREIEAARWIQPLLDELPQKSRSGALMHLFAENGYARSAVADIMAEFPLENDRIDIADGMLIPNGDSPWALDALNALGSEEARVKTLLNSVDHWCWDMKSPPDAETRRKIDYYSDLMDELRFSPEARGKIDAKLGNNR